MPRLLNVFDGGGNRLLSHSWSSISSDDLPFPVASLLASVHAYAGDSGWNLQHVELEYCNMTFRRGPQTQLLWVMLTDENEERVAKQIQAADALLLSLLGPAAFEARQPFDALKRQVKGVAPQVLDAFNAHETAVLSSK